ncbi:asparaginase [Fredinandcohnia sp. FSL W7-1320]|uniref:asparaginase n=1 Tax=Fredinandcohnia sp. FSL W7-1320 TaxID=2954540 RepID=UPI0030FDA200
MQQKNILIITLGGTILSQYDSVNQCVLPGYDKDYLRSKIIERVSNATIDILEFCQKPGPHLTPQLAISLCEFLEENQDYYHGFVVLQGTDTIEEFSYLVSLILDISKPVVFTGAMKSLNEHYSDAFGNIISAIRIACYIKKRDILVTLNEKIFLPEDIIKTHSSNIDSFQSDKICPIGIITEEIPQFFYHTKRNKVFDRKIEKRVEILKVSLGCDPLLLEYCIEKGTRGIVIEGFGAGNVPLEWTQSIKKAVLNKIPVVLATRCTHGYAKPLYGYEGGGKRLEDYGVIISENLSAAKARIKLMVLLGQTESKDLLDLKKYFSKEKELIVL